MYTLALTGGIGSGKSSALHVLQEHGAQVVDLDALSHEVLTWPQVRSELVEAFGPQIAGAEGKIIVPALAQAAFDSDGATCKLNAITHPAIWKALQQKLSEMDPHSLVVVEVQIAESLDPSSFDEIMTLSCPLEIRRARCIERGMTAEDFDRRNAAQTDDETRRALAHTVIDSSVTRDQLQAELLMWLEGVQPRMQADVPDAGVDVPEIGPDVAALAQPGPRFEPGWLRRLQSDQFRSPALLFVGRHNSGKTTALVQVISTLVESGVDVGSVKHHSHCGFDIDVEGKDSWRHKQAGAAEVAISAPDQFALVRSVELELTLADIIREMDPHDVVLVEGYRNSAIPSIEVMRAANPRDRMAGMLFADLVEHPEMPASEQEPLARERLGRDYDRLPDQHTVAIITDMPRVAQAAKATGRAAFGLNDYAAICDFIRAGLSAK